MTNKYPGKCASCGGRVAARAGLLSGSRGNWIIEHRDCAASGADAAPLVDTFRFGGDDRTVYTRNKRGRCEDAPCCGCCTI